MIISAYPVDCVCFCHLLKTQHYCLYPDKRHDLTLAAHSPPLPTPLTHLYPLIYATHDITVTAVVSCE